MELWVRSQDKKMLEKINGFEIVDGSTIQANGFPYGTYKTKERALEVLDEIQKILTPQLKTIRNEIEERKINEFSREILVKPVIEDVKICQFETYVYEMPKE